MDHFPETCVQMATVEVEEVVGRQLVSESQNKKKRDHFKWQWGSFGMNETSDPKRKLSASRGPCLMKKKKKAESLCDPCKTSKFKKNSWPFEYKFEFVKAAHRSAGRSSVLSKRISTSLVFILPHLCFILDL